MGIEDEGAHEGRRLIALVFIEFGQRLNLLRNDEPAVVPDAVEERQRPCHQGRVGGQGEGRLGVAGLEFHAVRGEEVDRRRLDVPAAVAGQTVGPHGVQADQDDVEIPAFAKSGEIGPARDEQEIGGDGAEDDPGGAQNQEFARPHFRVYSSINLRKADTFRPKEPE